MFFGLFNILFTIVFVAVAVVIIVTAIRSLGQWAKNNNSPRLTVPATVVAKRTNVDHHKGCLLLVGILLGLQRIKFHSGVR